MSLDVESNSPRASITSAHDEMILSSMAIHHAIPNSVLHLHSIAQQTQLNRITKLNSASSDMGDKKEAAVQNENVSTDSECCSDASNDLALLQDYEKLLSSFFHVDMSNGDKIEELRKLILKFGLPSINIGFERLCGLRSKIWKLVLGVPYNLNSFEYMGKIKDGPNTFDSKIRDDSFRTFKGDEEFWKRVDENGLIRVLNAIAVDFGYVQGMNVLLGPFLYIMPELDSFYCLNTLISQHCPRYVSKNIDGIHRACVLFDQCLSLLDPELHSHIMSKLPSLAVFSMPYIMTLFANMQPLNEVLKLWDAIFAFGIHFVIILLSSYLMLMRDMLLAQHRPYSLKCKMAESPLDSDLLIQCALGMVQFIPEDLFDELIKHPFM